MSDNRKYYYLKLKENYFDEDAIVLLESMQDGNLCTPVSRSDAQPGDLIFFTKTYSAATPVTHVGIYVGNGQMIHCGDPISYANINSNYWTSHFYGFGRLP